MKRGDDLKLENTEVIYSSEKCEILCGESTEGKRYIRKNKGIDSQTAELLIQVNSPYIARLVEYGKDYTISEYAEGVPLTEAHITPDRIPQIFIELCEGLSALHKARIIHRDIKPSNIILGDDGHVKLIDFDAARILKPAADKDTVFVGTDGFAPPEQYGFTQTDQRSDIYALGITMKVLLGEDYQHSRYRRIIEKCTRFSPEYRYKSMDKVRNAVILSRYSGAIIGASAGLAAAICFVVILAGFPHESVPEMVSSVPPEITSSVSTAVQTTGSSKAVTGPATTAPTTSSSQQTVSAEPVTSTDEPVEITEQTPASEPIIPATSASSSSAISSATTSTRATTHSTLPITTTTSTEPQKPVEIPAEISIPEDSVRLYSWDILNVPVGFPKLADSVSYFRAEKNRIEFSWDLSSEEEARVISEKISQWANCEARERTYIDVSWNWYSETYRIFEICYKYTEDRSYQLILQIECNIPSYEPFQTRKMNIGEFSIPENSVRPVSWDSVEIPEIFPKVTEHATEINVYAEEDEDSVLVTWDCMSPNEIATVIDILIKWYGDNDTLLSYYDGWYLYCLDNFSTRISPKELHFLVTENEASLSMSVSKS